MNMCVCVWGGGGEAGENDKTKENSYKYPFHLICISNLRNVSPRF